MTTKTHQEPRDEDELPGHPQLYVPKRPTLATALSLLASEINCHCTPETHDVIQEKSRDFVARRSQETKILLKVSVQDALHYAVIRYMISSDNSRFQQKKNALGRIAVSIVLATNLVNQFMTEGQIGKRPGWTWWSDFRFL